MSSTLEKIAATRLHGNKDIQEEFAKKEHIRFLRSESKLLWVVTLEEEESKKMKKKLGSQTQCCIN